MIFGSFSKIIHKIQKSWNFFTRLKVKESLHIFLLMKNRTFYLKSLKLLEFRDLQKRFVPWTNRDSLLDQWIRLVPNMFLSL